MDWEKYIMTDGNGRVTQKQLYDTLRAMEKAIMGQLEKNHDQTTDLKVDFARVAASVENNAGDIADLKKRSDLWDKINSFLVIIGAAIAALITPSK